jgi:hypothetical protein
MSTTILAPEQLLATEPKYHRGLKTPFRPEADRTITFTWVVGEGDKWKQTMGENERVTFLAVLSVTHNKKGRGAAHYSARLWQHQRDVDGSLEGCMFDAVNGTGFGLTDTNGAGRYNAVKLEAFAHYALKQLREQHATDPQVLRYFRPERV